MTRYVALDLETTSRNPYHAVPLEVAAVEYNPSTESVDHYGQTIEFVPFHDRNSLYAAEPGALAVNRYYERRLFDHMSSREESLDLAFGLVDLLDGATLVGANPAYDAIVLRNYLSVLTGRSDPPWHYRLFDVECATAAIRGLPAIPSLSKCLDEWDIQPLAASSHTALGDCYAVLHVFHAIRGHAARMVPL